MEGTVILLRRPKIEIVLERSGSVYWVKGWVFYPAPGAAGDEVVTDWSLYIEGELPFLTEKKAEERNKRWTISRLIAAFYPDRDIFIRDDEGERNDERLSDYLEDKFKRRLDVEIRSALIDKFGIDNDDIISLILDDPKVVLRRPKGETPYLEFRTLVYIKLRLPVKSFYKDFSPYRYDIRDRLSFLGEVAYRALPDELKDPDSVTKLLTETFPVVKSEYRLIPLRERTEVELWGVDIIETGTQDRPAFSYLEFKVPVTKDTAKGLLENRDNPEAVVMRLIAFLTFFPEGKLTVGRMNYYADIDIANQIENFRNPAQVSDLIEALTMFYEYEIKGEVG